MSESLWHNLTRGGQYGGFQRVDATHPLDLYVALNDDGHPGIVLFTAVALPAAPRLESLDVTESSRKDGRSALGIWLQDPSLLRLFDQLCRDLVEASRDVAVPSAPGFLLSRLRRWQSLLEGSNRGPSLMKLRGLVGELIVLRECLEHWDPAEVVGGWVGPLGEPQDFAFAEFLIEVKSVYPTAKTARITSVAQLDADRREMLAVVTLATLLPEGHGVDPLELVFELRDRIEGAGAPQAAATFMGRVGLTLTVDEAYTGPRFRVDETRYFDVADGFPRIRRLDLVNGVEDARYDILLAECAPFATKLRRWDAA